MALELPVGVDVDTLHRARAISARQAWTARSAFRARRIVLLTTDHTVTVGVGRTRRLDDEILALGVTIAIDVDAGATDALFFVDTLLEWSWAADAKSAPEGKTPVPPRAITVIFAVEAPVQAAPLLAAEAVGTARLTITTGALSGTVRSRFGPLRNDTALRTGLAVLGDETRSPSRSTDPLTIEPEFVTHQNVRAVIVVLASNIGIDLFILFFVFVPVVLLVCISISVAIDVDVRVTVSRAMDRAVDIVAVDQLIAVIVEPVVADGPGVLVLLKRWGSSGQPATTSDNTKPASMSTIVRRNRFIETS